MEGPMRDQMARETAIIGQGSNLAMISNDENRRKQGGAKRGRGAHIAVIVNVGERSPLFGAARCMDGQA